MNISEYNGDKKFLFLFLRDTILKFEKAASECAWDDEEKFSIFYDNVLQGIAKNKWDEALEEGYGPNQSIDPENPDADDFDMVVANFCAAIAGQEWPGNDVFKYLLAIRFKEVMEAFGDSPTDFLREIKRIESWAESLPAITGTEPSEDERKDTFFNAFEEEDQEWFEKTDNNGNHNRRTMSRLAVAKRMEANMTSRLSAAKKAIANKNDRGGGNDGKGNGKRKRGSGNSSGESDNTNDSNGERDSKRET